MRKLSLLSLVLFLPSIGMANRESDYSKIAVLRMQSERYLTSLPNSQPAFANYGEFDVEKNLSKTLGNYSSKYSSLLEKVSSRQELENALFGIREKTPGVWVQDLSGRWNVVYTCSYPANIHFGASTYHCNPVSPSPYFHFQMNSKAKWIPQGQDGEFQTKKINAINDGGEINDMGIQIHKMTAGVPVDLNFDFVELNGNEIKSVYANCDKTKDHLIVCFHKQKISENSVYYQPDLNSEDHPDLEDNSAGEYYIIQVLADLKHETDLRNQE